MIIWLLLILQLVFMVTTETSDVQVKAATTLYVGPNENYTKIQDAIDAAQPGDEVVVENGKYLENLVISKSLTLRGEDKGSTIINGSESNGDGMVIIADHVNITGFTIMFSGSTWGGAGIRIADAENCNITDNIINANHHGIMLTDSNETIISGNKMSFNNGSGIYLDRSHTNTISNNEIYPGNLIGISIGSSNDNSIINNRISESKRLGIDTWQSRNNIYKNNDFLQNKGNAIEFWTANSNFFENNNVTNNGGDGIQLQSSRSNTFRYNRLKEDGFSFGGIKVAHWNSHTIDVTNFVNSKPVYYKKNHQGGSVATGAGQVILANCTGVTVENQEISKTSEGIILGFSSFNTITNNKVTSNSRYGITVWKSNDNTFSDNDLDANKEIGIYIWDSNKNTLEGNSIKNHQIGIELRSTRNQKLKDNVLVDNSIYITGNYLFDFWRDVYPDRITDDEDKVIWVYSDAYWTTHTIDTSNTVNGNPIQYWSRTGYTCKMHKCNRGEPKHRIRFDRNTTRLFMG
jgi:parallel beta-helix repeat protein